MTESERAEIVHVDPAVVGPRLQQLLVQQLVVPYEAVPVERPAERDGQRPVVRLRGGLVRVRDKVKLGLGSGLELG